MKNYIVVTGGAGFVGSNLIEFLLAKTDFKIISLDNYSTGSKKNHFINSTGIFKRTKSGNQALYIFEKRAVQYKKTFPFFDIMIKKSSRIFDHFFQKNLQKNINNTQELINKGLR